TLTGFNSTPSVGATDWMAANWPGPAASAGSRRTPARRTLGAISFSSSSHFALKLYSNEVNPVALPPGRARLSTNPAPNRSGTIMLQALKNRAIARLPHRVVRHKGIERAHAPHPLALLRARRKRPRSRHAAEQRDERAALHDAILRLRKLRMSGTISSALSSSAKCPVSIR